ncbi:MAG TPA: SpoIIE family protein phosphatase [Verrucomicrobiae bacterium]|nr:SpoIIE family protein phosphatase [Verrucomicrobiae bacterium]
MQTDGQRRSRPLGITEIAFFACVTAFILLHAFGANILWQGLIALPMIILAIATAYRTVRRILRGAIWRLRNRLMVAYLFIALVPVVLILAMAGLAGYVVIGEMAVYLANRELDSHLAQMHRQALVLARVPARDPEGVLQRTEEYLHANSFADFELVATGAHDLRYPPDGSLAPPDPQWLKTVDPGKRGFGLAVMHPAGKPEGLYAWAHAAARGNTVTIVAPIRHELLTTLVPGLGVVSFIDPLSTAPAGLTGTGNVGRIPAKSNLVDAQVEGLYPVDVSYWGEQQKPLKLFLVVTTRFSAVLSTVFQKPEWNEFIFVGLVTVFILLLLVELAALVAGVQLSRTITGAVHELYEGTQHVKDGDFSYRIPVKGHDQLADLTKSFNTMTVNLGSLIVVAKEKERLESELAIAREVQNQLFPREAPKLKTLQLRGVCQPARMVSGDYYDFMRISDKSVGFAIGDVAGKGISAALLMATIQSTMRMQLSHTNGSGPVPHSTASLVATLNRQLYATTAPEKYATFYFALYDEESSSLTYTNAGHPPPMLLSGSEFQTLDSNGTVVGAFPTARYGERTVPLKPGDLLVAYTDGIIEPENAYGEMFGEDRLKDLLLKHESADSSEIIAHAMEAVVEWTGSSELQDDMTMIVVRHL